MKIKNIILSLVLFLSIGNVAPVNANTVEDGYYNYIGLLNDYVSDDLDAGTDYSNEIMPSASWTCDATGCFITTSGTYKVTGITQYFQASYSKEEDYMHTVDETNCAFKISDAGCHLTSAAMVMNYLIPELTITPQTLNNTIAHSCSFVDSNINKAYGEYVYVKDNSVSIASFSEVVSEVAPLINKNQLVVLMGAKPKNAGTHYVAVYGYDYIDYKYENGNTKRVYTNLYIYDPGYSVRAFSDYLKKFSTIQHIITFTKK